MDDVSDEKRRIMRETSRVAKAAKSLEREGSRMKEVIRQLKKKKMTPGPTLLPSHSPSFVICLCLCMLGSLSSILFTVEILWVTSCKGGSGRCRDPGCRACN